jgi:putative SOS response-associated peptidase YedK
MCGRYAASRNPDELVEEFEVEQGAVHTDDVLPARYNIAPTDPVYAVLARPPRGAPEAAATRQLRVVKWGLVPSWAKDPGIGSRLINARMETVDEKPAFRKAFAARRCLLPADGYYEWYVEESRRDARGKPVKQPFFIHPRDGGVLAMAGLYELWRDPAKPREADDAWLWTATVITTTAEDSLGRIHDRMPMIVEPERWSEWLDPGIDDVTELRSLLVPAAPGRLEAYLEAYPVSTQVNSVRNDGSALIAPVPAEPEGGGTVEDEPDDTLF